MPSALGRYAAEGRFSAVGRSSRVLDYRYTVLGTQPDALLAYWSLGDASGLVAEDISGNNRDGAYTAITLGQTGIGDGSTAAGFDGSTSYLNAYSAALAAVFTGGEFTISLWFKVANAGVWTDTTNRRLLTLQVDSNNRILLQKTTTANQLNWFYQAGGTSKSVSKTTTTPTGWVQMAVSVSKTANEMKPYYNGVQEGITQTGLGTFAGSLAATTTAIGSSNSNGPVAVWNGSLAHVAVWNVALTGTEVAYLAVPS
jgi:hypothetical protein